MSHDHRKQMQMTRMLAIGMLSILVFLVHIIMADASQAAFQVPNDRWCVSLRKDWDVLGPFPIQAREQNILSPSFPVDLSKEIDYNATWPSSYADGGTVGWSAARSNEHGQLDVSFPDIRWASIRATEGWAGLQHHSVLHTTITVYPPTSIDSPASIEPPHLLVDILQGSFFTLLPSNPRADAVGAGHEVPEWYAGNIYAIGSSPPQTIALPASLSTISPTTFDLFVSGDYEIRLFGDPRHDGGKETPVLSITLSVDIEPHPSTDVVVRDASHDVFPDFVDGWAFGSALGIGMRSVSGWWTIKSIYVEDEEATSIQVQNVAHETRLAPTQTRIIPLRIIQNAPFYSSTLPLRISLESETSSTTVHAALSLTHHSQWSDTFSPQNGIKATYFFATTMATAFLVVPPIEKNSGQPHVPVLTLHGSGVNIFEHLFLVHAFPRQERSWLILPSGRTSWGLDWHGPSVQDVWGTVNALYTILHGHQSWHPWALTEGTRVLVTGHSNGGQGTWYLASRYPDRVIGAVPAAGFIKMQSYVPLTQSRSAHFIDPSLRAILDSSSTPDDNDLFLSNLVDIPVLAVHGGDDDNVPVWHTREYVNILKTWNANANVTYREDRGQLHWYPTIFSNEQVQQFIKSIVKEVPSVGLPAVRSASFTLTVSLPAESDELHGWRIRALLVPGRLARLHVQEQADIVHVQTTNVRTFSIRLTSLLKSSSINIDGQGVWTYADDTPHDIVYFSYEHGSWQLLATPAVMQTSGRIQRILSTLAPFTIVVPQKQSTRMLSSALRIAHDLNLYHRLDSEIIDDHEAMQRLESGGLGHGNIISLGGLQSRFFKWTVRQGKTPFNLQNEKLQIRGRAIDGRSLASLFLHPHPSEDDALMLMVYASDDEGLEKAVRLFPIRTGINVPDWIIVGGRSDNIGAGDVRGAGVWGNDWSWNDPVSAF